MTRLSLGDLLNDAAPKAFFAGAERSCAPAETFERVRPHMAEMGITRLAELTGLDTIGIPTFQAVRPMARSLSVNQGKGIDPMTARVSALMEGAETWHAENPVLAITCATREQLRSRVRCLDLQRMSVQDDTPFLELDRTKMGWVMGIDLVTGDDIAVPTDCVLMDYSQAPDTKFLHRTSNGLASGNSRCEAAVSALLEVIERDCNADFKGMARSARDYLRVKNSAVQEAIGAQLRDALSNANAHVEVWDMTNDIGVPAFYAILQSGVSAQTGKLLRGFAGSGCHLNPKIALSRAVTEAVQSRLTVISGARDDLTPTDYEPPGPHPIELMTTMFFEAERGGSIPYGSKSTARSSEDLKILIDLIKRVGCDEIALVDLTHEDKEIAVVRAVIPGMGQPIGKNVYRSGLRHNFQRYSA